MFDKLRQLQQLNKIKELVAQEKAEVEKNGIKVVVNGKMEIEEIILNSNLEKENQEKILKDCINEAFRKIQIVIAQKLLTNSQFI